MSSKVAPIGTAEGGGATGGDGPAAAGDARSSSSSTSTTTKVPRVSTKLDLDPALQRSKQQGAKSQPYIQTRDKIMFLLAVANVIVLAFLTGGFQWLMPYYYTLTALPLLTLRFWEYAQGNNGKYAYFLLDLCYWGNFLLIIYLWTPSYKYSDYFFACVFALANGPMAWAVIIFRNSMVFHSLDKTISNFIHLAPLLTVFAIRWHSPIAENLSTNTTDIAGHVRDVFLHNWTGLGRFKVCEVDHPCWAEHWWLSFFLIPAGAQFVWGIFYALSSRVCCKLQRHHVDAFRYLTANGGVLASMGKWKNQTMAYFVYNLLNYAANLAMTLPAPLFYWNYYANLSLIALLFMSSIWNGANFYIDVFSKKYLAGVKKRQRADLAARLASGDLRAVAQEATAADCGSTSSSTTTDGTDISGAVLLAVREEGEATSTAGGTGEGKGQASGAAGEREGGGAVASKMATAAGGQPPLCLKAAVARGVSPHTVTM